MATVNLDPKSLVKRLQQDAARSPGVVLAAMTSAAHRGRRHLVKNSPVDRGALRVAWRVIRLSNGVELDNDMPYAGILERGSGPFKISTAGIFALKGWVMRMFRRGKMFPTGARMSIKTRRRSGPTGFALEAEAERIAWAIAKNWEKNGRRGKFFVRDALPHLAVIMQAEFQRFLAKFFDRK